MNYFGLYGKILNRGLAVLTSLSLGQYNQDLVSYFTVKTSLSVNKQLILQRCFLRHGRQLTAFFTSMVLPV